MELVRGNSLSLKNLDKKSPIKKHQLELRSQYHRSSNWRVIHDSRHAIWNRILWVLWLSEKAVFRLQKEGLSKAETFPWGEVQLCFCFVPQDIIPLTFLKGVKDIVLAPKTQFFGGFC